MNQDKADKNGLANTQLQGQADRHAHNKSAQDLQATRQENFHEVFQKTVQLNFDADGEKQKGNTDIGHQLDAGNVVNQFQTERPDENAGDQKPDDGGQLHFIEDVYDRDGETENDDQLVKKFQSIHRNFRSLRLFLRDGHAHFAPFGEFKHLFSYIYH